MNKIGPATTGRPANQPAIDGPHHLPDIETTSKNSGTSVSLSASMPNRADLKCDHTRTRAKPPCTGFVLLAACAGFDESQSGPSHAHAPIPRSHPNLSWVPIRPAHDRKNLPALCSSTAMSSSCINAYLSGMSRQTTVFPFRSEPNFFDNFTLCARSMTKIISAHAICSADTSVIASGARPAESASTPSQEENTSSAVGLRSRFRLQMNSARVNLSYTKVTHCAG